jgi:hypothetical protein
MSFTYAYKSRRAGEAALYGMLYVSDQDRRYVNSVPAGNGLFVHIMHGAVIYSPVCLTVLLK